MARTLSIAAVATALLSLAIAPGALAVGLGQQRAVAVSAKASEASEGLVASSSACPGQSNLDASPQAQRQAMLCLTEFARTRAGLPGFAAVAELDSSADGKAGDILRCNDFSHFACGREFTYWMEQASYTSTPCWRAGENLAWGTGEDGTVRSIFRAWLRSPGHRQNILGDFEQIGISLRVGKLDGLSGVHVWAQHFGTRCTAG
jgi:uncharacterized protein YkwD